MDLLQHMTTFVRVADSGSISAAARSLRLSTAMASRHLRALEEHLGVELVRRTTRHLALTEAGTEYLSRARALLAGVEEAADVVRPGRGASGLLVVSLPVSFGLAQLGPLFAPLLAKHPRLKLDLRFEDRIVDLLGDGIDVAIRAGLVPPDSPFLVARTLARTERLLCAAPSLVAKIGKITSLTALERAPCIIHGSAPSPWPFETPNGPQTILVNGPVRTNNIFAIRELTLAGVGVGRLPLWLVDDDLKKRRLVPLLPEVKLPVVDVYGLYHHGSRGSGAIRVLLDFLAEELPRRTKMLAP